MINKINSDNKISQEVNFDTKKYRCYIDIFNKILFLIKFFIKNKKSKNKYFEIIDWEKCNRTVHVDIDPRTFRLREKFLDENVFHIGNDIKNKKILIKIKIKTYDTIKLFYKIEDLEKKALLSGIIAIKGENDEIIMCYEKNCNYICPTVDQCSYKTMRRLLE